MLTLFTGIFFAVISEVGKLFIEGRHCDLDEMGWNVIGAVVGVIIMVLVKSFWGCEKKIAK